MASRPVYNASNLASGDASVAGRALSVQFQLQGYPESNRKRSGFNLSPPALTVGNDYKPTYIDGRKQFDFRLARNSTAILKFLGTYVSDVPGQFAAFEYTVAAHNTVDNTLILRYNTNYQARSSAEIVFPTYDSGGAPDGDVLFIFVAGANTAQRGRWDIRCVNLSEAVQP